MQKIFCDRCGEDVGEDYIYLRISKFFPYDSTDCHLCSDCIEELEEWLKIETQEKPKIRKEDLKYILYCITGGIIGGIIPNIVKWLIF